ncbi:hypothetical protein KAR91_53950 [Candidatus Pacearchaeota archaeon]|nr:hypothetical protein [Candidatus Pacearchaeota archaeon]
MSERSGRLVGWEHSEAILDGITSEALHMQPLGAEGGKAAVTLIAGAGTAKIQFTTSLTADVISDDAVWQDWDKGEVTGTVTDTLRGPASALRCVSVSGNVAYEVMV